MVHNLVFRVLGMLILLVTLLPSCDSTPRHQAPDQDQTRYPLKLKYAKRFQVWTTGNTIEIKVNSGMQSGDTVTYKLISVGESIPSLGGSDQIIETPIKDLVVTSTSHIPFLNLLGVSEKLVGFPNTDYISSPLIRERIDRGLVKNVGDASGLNFESLITLAPALVITYLSGVDRGELQELTQSGIPYVLNFDFMEESPLGRAEWIKFMGLLLGKFELADSVFNEIEKEYLMLKSTADQLSSKPTVFSGILYGDTWFAPGANSFAASLIQDAGGIYTWSDRKVSGSVELSLEAVIDRNIETDFWIGTADYASKTVLAKTDSRYAKFKAFKTDQIYNVNGRVGATGGLEYYELAGARPDIVLRDLIKIFHPDLLPRYELYFYRKLD